MWEELQELKSGLGRSCSEALKVECIDIVGEPSLEERYGTRVPVIEVEGRSLCQYFLDANAVKECLSRRSIGV
jgi:hypothetical protein